jgi:transcriptional regulator with XRE-family HTH domain
MSTLGTKIKELRFRNEMTQEELAQKLKIKRPTLANWETDRATPDYAKIKEMARIFGVSVDYLLGQTNQVSDHIPYVVLSEEDLELLRRIKGLSNQSRKTIETVVTSMECYEREQERSADKSSGK